MFAEIVPFIRLEVKFRTTSLDILPIIEGTDPKIWFSCSNRFVMLTPSPPMELGNMPPSPILASSSSNRLVQFARAVKNGLRLVFPLKDNEI